MKTFFAFVLGLALLALGVLSGSLFGNEKTSSPTEQTAAVAVSQPTRPTLSEQSSVGHATGNPQPKTETTVPSRSSPTTPEPLETPSPRGLGTSPLKGAEGVEERTKVVRVIDGDTIEVEIDGKKERVRYIGIDTPETVDPRKTVQCFGVEASKKNKELVEGKMVRLEKDITDRDKYNRLLRYVYVEPQMNADRKPQIDPSSAAKLTTGHGADTETRMDADNPDEIFVNLALVEQGFASSYSYPPDIKYQDLFVAAERQARENKLGLWLACAPAV